MNKAINKKQMKEISKFAINIDWNKAFSGKSKGNMHLLRVVKNSQLLGEGLNIDTSIVEAGAWLHDTGLAKGSSAHPLAYRKKIIQFLKKLDVKEDAIKRILHCIESHDGRIKARTLEAKIVHDADTLDKMGPLGVIRETWKKSSESWTSDKIASHLRPHLRKRKNKIYTKKANRIASLLDKELKSFFKILNHQLGGIK